MTVRVLIADDHDLVRRGLREVLDAYGGLRVVGEVSDGWEVLRFPTDAYDVLILDLSLPRMSGLETLKRLREAEAPVAVVVVSMYPEAVHAPMALQAGAQAYVSKDQPADAIVAAVRAAASGERLPSSEAASADLPRLTSREHQVFLLLHEGRTVGEIAAELGVLSSTVSNHVARLRTKLHARSLVELVQRGTALGLHELP